MKRVQVTRGTKALTPLTPLTSLTSLERRLLELLFSRQYRDESLETIRKLAVKEHPVAAWDAWENYAADRPAATGSKASRKHPEP